MVLWTSAKDDARLPKGAALSGQFGPIPRYNVLGLKSYEYGKPSLSEMVGWN
jgi:hypothetical protein